MNNECKKLIAHISRIEGQLEAVKKELAKNDIDCIKASQIILASSRSFASFRMSFIKSFLNTKFKIGQSSDQNDTKLIENLLSIIKA